LNPSGIQGAIYPLSIWTNYGLAVIENQPVLVLEAQHYNGPFTLIKLTLLALYASFIPLWGRAERFPVGLFALAAVIGGMAWMAIRHQTLLAFFSLAVIAISASLAGFRRLMADRKPWVALTLGLIMLGGVANGGRELLARKQTIGLNLVPGKDAAAGFLSENFIPGPVLNNFDISGYLIYYLFPQYRPYVDSRPEAYTSAFWQDSYRGSLTNESLWAQLLDRYAFNVIMFSRSSSWENEFLVRRVMDPQWATVFDGTEAVILLRRTAANASLIGRYEIPKARILRPN
jgi:hypothetical protein